MNNKLIYKVKSHIDINDGLYRYDFDNDYKYCELVVGHHISVSERSITVDDLCESNKYRFKKKKRLFSKKEYLEIIPFLEDNFKINIEDIKTIKYIVEYEPCLDVTIDFLAKHMYHHEFLDYVSDKLGVTDIERYIGEFDTKA